MNTIKELREKTELSQSKFACAYGIPLRTLQRWEQGQNCPPDYVINLLKCTIEYESASSEGLRIPIEFKAFFWDTDFRKLDIIKNRNYIIARLFTKGGIRGIRWLTDTYLPEDIVCAAKKRRDLNPIVANFLSQKYNIRREEMRYYSNAESNWR